MSVLKQSTQTEQRTRIAVCQMNVIAKRPDLNTAKMLEWIKQAAQHEANIVVFPEMAIPGYLVGDDWEDQAFLTDCANYALEVHALAESLGVLAVFGNVTQPRCEPALGEDGRPLKFNSVEATVPGVGVFEYNKINLPNYREFDDKRHFQSGAGNMDVIVGRDFVVSVSVCEDGWDDDYAQKPITQALDATRRKVFIKKGMKNIHLNLSCSPFTLGKNGARDRRFAHHSRNFDALVYVNNVGVQNNGKNVFVFDGSSTIYSKGKFVCSLPPLVEGIGYFHFGVYGQVMAGGAGLEWCFDNPLNEHDKKNHRDPSKQDVLAYAIREFCAQSNIKRVVIGLSGGIDSALSTMLHVKALGKENVITVNMPTKFNSETTKGIAKTIAGNLGVRYLEVPIGGLVTILNGEVGLCMAGSGFFSPEDLRDDQENVQARMRGAGVQAFIAATLGAVFPNNGNKAEAAVGYCTMLGDMAGYLAPIADLWKHEVYEIAEELSKELGDVLPEEIFTLVPSAELSTEHNVDQGKGDPIKYFYHDKLFASWIEPWSRKNIEDTLSDYAYGTLLRNIGVSVTHKHEFEALFPTPQAFINDLERWWKLFKGMGIVKRVQSPPIVVISRRAFGFDFRESIGSVYFTKNYIALKCKLLTTTHTLGE